MKALHTQQEELHWAEPSSHEEGKGHAKPPIGKRKNDRGRASHDGTRGQCLEQGAFWLGLSHQHRRVSAGKTFSDKGECFLAEVERMESS